MWRKRLFLVTGADRRRAGRLLQAAAASGRSSLGSRDRVLSAALSAAAARRRARPRTSIWPTPSAVPEVRGAEQGRERGRPPPKAPSTMARLASTGRDSKAVPGSVVACSPTTTCTCARTRLEATAEEYFTEENVDRYLAAAEEHGIDELGVSEHIYRFTQALEIWTHPYWEGQAVDDLDAYCRVRPHDARCGSGSSATSSRAARTGSPACWRRRLRLRGRLRPLPGRRGAVDDQRYDVWEYDRRRRLALEHATSAGRPSSPAPASSTSSPTRTW